MPNIVPSLFGLNPDQVRQARSSDIQIGSANFAQMSPEQRAQSMLYQGGAGLGQAAGGMLGFQDPMMAQARSRQQIGSQMDMTTPEGYYAAAQQAQARGDVELATNLVSAGRELEQSMATDQFKIAQAQRMAQGKSVTGKPIKAVVDRNGENWNALITQEGDVIRYLSKVAGKGAATKDGGASIVEAKFSEIENAMADTLGIDRNDLTGFVKNQPKETEKRLEETTGFIQGAIPAWAQGQKQVDMRSHLERLKSLGQTMGVINLREAGVAPGSITVNEWPKFQADLANIDVNLGGKALAKQYARIIEKMERFRDDLKSDLNKGQQSTSSSNLSIEDRLAKYNK